MEFQTYLFLFLSSVSVLTALGVLFHSNPLFSSLFLALCMTSLSGLFFLLKAYFLAGVQLIVYAGAVMTLFIMVIMLFNFSERTHRRRFYLKKRFFLTLFVLGWFCALISLASLMSVDLVSKNKFSNNLNLLQLAEALFSKYILAFELLGVLLLVVAVAAVAITKEPRKEVKDASEF